MFELRSAKVEPLKASRLRGLRLQKPRRESERVVRVSVVAFTRWSRVSHGWEVSQAAACLGLTHNTLDRWNRRWRQDHMKLKPRGRPIDRADRDVRQAVLSMFSLMGPRVGLPTLQAIFPDVARSQLIELQRRYRFAYLKNKRVLLHALRWTRPGSVWATDFSDAPCAIDGAYDKLFMVNDLASRMKIEALPTDNEEARTARRSLEAHFFWHGAPLVLKCDNGSAYISEELRECLSRHGVLPLFSPPYTPAYNGSTEAGNGSIKTRAHHESARHDRPGQWTCDDIEAARLLANETSRIEGATPDVLWARRTRITPEERRTFLATYHRHQLSERRDRGVSPDTELERHEQASLDRVAITRALVELGYLLVRRRRITLPLSHRLMRKIS